MKNILLSLSFLVFSTNSNGAQNKEINLNISSESATNSVYIESLVQLSLDYLNHNQFDCVFAISKKLQSVFPQDPKGYLIEANACQVMMRDYRVRIQEERFEKHIFHAIKLARDKLKEEKTAENYFFLGSAQGYLSFHQFRKGQWLKALNGILKSINKFRRAYSVDKNFVDPLLGLALYEYGKSKVPLLGGDLDKAIQYLEKVEGGAKYVAADALYSKQLVYFQMEEFEKALTVNDRIYVRYPKSAVCLYNRGLLLEKAGRNEDAIETWKSLITVIEAFVKPSNGYLAECHYHLSKIYFELGQSEKAVHQLNKAVQYVSRYKPEEELDGPYVSFKDVKKAIRKLNAKYDIANGNHRSSAKQSEAVKTLVAQ